MAPRSPRKEQPTDETGWWIASDGFWYPPESTPGVSQPESASPGSALPVEAKGHNGRVSFDGAFVTITRKGGLARMSVGKGEKRIPIASITAVQWKPPGTMVNGYIAFTIAGGNEKQARFGSQTYNAVKDENAVIVTKSQKAAFLALREAVESAIAAHHRPASAPIVQQVSSTADEIKKLAELHAAGALTDEEFAQHKAKLLG
jgi:Domain of unknown function (DUF4429)/Short C-terminal domain